MKNQISAQVTKSALGKYSFIMSSEAVDRVGDIVSPTALEKAAASIKKLVALYQHDDTKPIGFWSNLRVEAGKLKGDLTLAPTNLSKMIVALLDAGTPLGASIGFVGKGKANGGGMTYNEIQLLETSIVSIPCNAEAMQIAKNFGYDITPDDQSRVVEEPEAASGPILEETLQKSKAAILRANLSLRN